MDNIINDYSYRCFFENIDGTYTYIMTAVGDEYKTYIKCAEVERDRYGIIVAGSCDRNNKVLGVEKI